MLAGFTIWTVFWGIGALLGIGFFSMIVLAIIRECSYVKSTTTIDWMWIDIQRNLSKWMLAPSVIIFKHVYSERAIKLIKTPVRNDAAKVFLILDSADCANGEFERVQRTLEEYNTNFEIAQDEAGESTYLVYDTESDTRLTTTVAMLILMKGMRIPFDEKFQLIELTDPENERVKWANDLGRALIEAGVGNGSREETGPDTTQQSDDS